MESRTTSLRQSLGALEYFTFGFGSMVGAGWLVVMDDWLGRGGPGGAMLGFLGGALLLMPVALTYGRLVRMIPDAGAEVAYTERVFPTTASFIAGWMMMLAYAIVCPWEAVAIGNLLARLFPEMNAVALYTVAGKVITLPRLVAGLVLTAVIGVVNYRGIRLSGRFQDLTTIGLLACFAVFVLLGIGRGSATNMQPLFAPAGPFVSVLLVLQIVPYFMAGFESIPKASEEALPGLQPGTLSRLITVALLAGGLFYVVVVGVVSWVYPWTGIVGQQLGTDAVTDDLEVEFIRVLPQLRSALQKVVPVIGDRASEFDGIDATILRDPSQRILQRATVLRSPPRETVGADGEVHGERMKDEG